MAGLGYKVFASGAVLTASQVQGYLQDQAVMKFASASARDAALASPTEGMVCYLADSSSMFAYDGTSWVVIPAVSQFISNTTNTISSPTAALQNVMATSGSGASLVAATTYRIKGSLRVSYVIQVGNSTLPNFALTYSGTAASSQIIFNTGYNTAGFSTGAQTNVYSPTQVVSSNINPAPTLSGFATVYNTIQFDGLIRTSTSGTLTPQYGFSSNTGITALVCQANSYFEVIPVGSSTMTSAGTWV